MNNDEELFRQLSKGLFQAEAERLRALNPEPPKPKFLWLGTLFGYAVGILTIAICAIIGGLYGVFSTGFIVMKMWQWFLVPIHVPAIGLFHAAGIMVLVRLFTYQYRRNPREKAETKKQEWMEWGIILLYPWFAFGVGYIIHLFV